MGWTIQSARDCGGFDLLPLLVEGGGSLELHLGGGSFAFEADVDEHAFAASVEEVLTAAVSDAYCSGVQACLQGSMHFFISP